MKQLRCMRCFPVKERVQFVCIYMQRAHWLQHKLKQHNSYSVQKSGDDYPACRMQMIDLNKEEEYTQVNDGA